MSGFTASLFRFFLGLGAAGPFVLGVIDALLFTPFANDVLVVSLTTRHRESFWLYALAAAAGSTCGCFILDAISRKGGEAGLEKTMKPERLEKLKRRIGSRAGWAIALACIMPPPFPFTPVIAGAAALQYPRPKLLGIVAVVRLLRFGLLAYLAVRFGRHILRWAESPAVHWSVVALIVLSVAGSIWTIVTRLRR